MKCFLALLFLISGSWGTCHAQSDLASRKVLILHSFGYAQPVYKIIDDSLKDAFTANGLDFNNLYFEFLDLARNPGPEYRHDMADIFRRKFQERKLDLVVTLHQEALQFLLNEGRTVYPEGPIISILGDSTFTEYSDPKRPLIHLPFTVDVIATAREIYRLKPDTRKIVVIAGSSALDRRFEHVVVTRLKAWKRELDVESVPPLPMADILRMVANLPAGTAVLYTTMYADSTGKAYMPTDAARMISAAANAPLFGLYETLLGDNGIVGGIILDHREEGQRAVQIAMSVLRGNVPLQPITILPAPLSPVFDWQQLDRWGFDGSILPAGTVVLNRPKTLWSDYREYVIAAVILFLAQSLLIGALVFQTLRRRKAERKYRDIFEGSLEGIFETTREGRMMTANPALAGILGYGSAADAMTAITDSASQVWVDPDEREKYLRLLEEQDVVLGYQCLFRRKDGQEIWVSLNTRRVTNPNGKKLFYSGFMEDITVRKKAEEALRESDAKYRNLYDSMMDGYVLVDMDGRILQYNETYRAMTGYSQDELQKLTYRDITPEKWHEGEKRIITEQVFARGYSDVYEKEYRHKDGTVFPIELRAFRLKDERGNDIGMWAIVRDISGRKQIESETRKLREDLAHVTRVSTLGELTSSLAHEINQPLAAILSNAQAAQRFLSQDNPDMKEIAEILGDIIRDDNRAAEVIRKIRALLKKDETSFEALSLNDVVEEILNVIRNDTALATLTLEKAFAPTLPAVWGDRIQLQQVILNLVMNAAEAMRDGSTRRRILTVRTSKKDERFAEVSVVDTGPGVDEKTAGRIFEPFYTTKSGGMGMGLAISQHIVASHKGQMRAVNNPDRGATISFTVPFDNGGRP
jgi:PAS domain S-box-containing protein